MGVEWYGPRGTAASRRFINSSDFAPGTFVFKKIVDISLPSGEVLAPSRANRRRDN
jgi:hypothetical protein